MEQVLVPANTAATAIPAIELVFFDPAAGDYRVARHEPIPLTVRPRAEGDTALITGRTTAARPAERLGEDLVYLKGDLGTAVLSRPFAGGTGFWLLHIGPLTVVVGLIVWKRRQDRLRSDVAYARRSRAARRAHRLLADAANHGEVQRALQQYLGDRLNLPGGGITAAIIDDKLRPLGLTEESAGRLRHIFEQCDTARFAGGAGGGTEVAGLVAETRNAIDELERTHL